MRSKGVTLKQISERREKAIAMLRDGARQKDVAIALGVTPECVSVWRKRSNLPSAFEVRSRKILTDREQEILLLIWEGMTDREIADRLFVSTRTVESHIRSTFEKAKIFGRAASRIRLIRWAIDKGLIQRIDPIAPPNYSTQSID